jgi:chemotaxis methyl-accepting protein methylase
MFYRHIIRTSLKKLWTSLPGWLRASPPGIVCGRSINSLIRHHARRTQYFGTFFLRNKAELELLQLIIKQCVPHSRLDVAIIACSKGAEVYSILWALRSVRPDVQIVVTALDISQEILDFARQGVYARNLNSTHENAPGSIKESTDLDQPKSIFERLTPEEMRSIFDYDDTLAKVKPWLKEGINWVCMDACDPELSDVLPRFDIVIANRFMCHMVPRAAEKCLRNLAKLAKPGGFIFVSGIDLDVRVKVARDLCWSPISELIQEVHEGDSSLRNDWPLEYWGLEPMNRQRQDWQIRYSAAFQVKNS